MMVLASVSAESILALGAGLLFAGAYTGLAVLTPHYKETKGREKITTEVAAGFALVGSFVVLVGAFSTNVGIVGSVLLGLLLFYILCVLAPIIKHIVSRPRP